MRAALARAVDVLGDPWSFLVLREAFFGVRRFETVQRNLGIARNLLASRLKNLTKHGLFFKVQYQDRPARYEYRLSERGQGLYPSIIAMLQWGNRWCASDAGPPLRLTHRPCGRQLEQSVLCSECDETIQPDDVITEEAGTAKSVPRASSGATRRSSDREIFVRGRHCSVARSLQVVGDRWTFHILREAFASTQRFEDLQGRLGIARNILTDRLSRLVADDVMERRLYTQRPDRYEYALTEKGRDLFHVVLAMQAWGDRWLTPEGEVPALFLHRKCGKRFTPTFVCAHCRRPLLAREVRHEPGPGAGFRPWGPSAPSEPTSDSLPYPATR